MLEAQEIIKRDPNNLEAHKLLGRIYLRSLGDLQPGTQSREVLSLAIEQYEAITKIEPKNADNHLLLGRLYFLNKDAVKAESEFKSALSLDPNSEEAITNLAYLYNDEGANNKAAELFKTVPEGQRSAKIYSALGTTYEQQKDYKNAIASFRQALAMDKENLDAMRGLAQNLANDNQIDAALDEYRTIQDADPQDATAALRVAEIIVARVSLIWRWRTSRKPLRWYRTDVRAVQHVLGGATNYGFSLRKLIVEPYTTGTADNVYSDTPLPTHGAGVAPVDLSAHYGHIGFMNDGILGADRGQLERRYQDNRSMGVRVVQAVQPQQGRLHDREHVPRRWVVLDATRAGEARWAVGRCR